MLCRRGVVGWCGARPSGDGRQRTAVARIAPPHRDNTQGPQPGAGAGPAGAAHARTADTTSGGSIAPAAAAPYDGGGRQLCPWRGFWWLDRSSQLGPPAEGVVGETEGDCRDCWGEGGGAPRTRGRCVGGAWIGRRAPSPVRAGPSRGGGTWRALGCGRRGKGETLSGGKCRRSASWYMRHHMSDELVLS